MNTLGRETPMTPSARSAPAPPKVGALALQGDFSAHLSALEHWGAEAREVRRVPDLLELDGLAMPGGESTTMLRLLREEGLDRAIVDFHRRGGAILGTCAGLILLARDVEGTEQESLGLLDVTVERNAYGRQVESFVDTGHLSLPGEEAQQVEMIFIRAPRIRKVGPGVHVLGTRGDQPVLVQQERILGAAFHPELLPGSPVHRFFVRLLCARPATHA